MAEKHKHVPVAFAPDLTPDSQAIALHGDEAHHLIHVLRVRPAQIIELTNGNGLMGKGVITHVGKKQVDIQIEHTTVISPSVPEIHLIIAPIRANRMEWLIEKATEMGVASITPVTTRHTVIHHFNRHRMQRVAISALKQSRQAYLPTIHPLLSWEKWLSNQNVLDSTSIAMVAHPDARYPSMHALVSDRVQRVYIFIGPEGGFHSDEVHHLIENGFHPVRLSATLLRSETAAVTAIAQLILLFL